MAHLTVVMLHKQAAQLLAEPSKIHVAHSHVDVSCSSQGLQGSLSLHGRLAGRGGRPVGLTPLVGREPTADPRWG